MRGRPVLALPGVLAGALAVLLAPAAAGAQEEPGPSGPPDEPEAPAMAEAPRQFHLGLTASALSWSDAAGPTPDASGLVGVELERLLVRFASVRLGGAYGTSTVAGAPGAVDVNAALFEVGLTGRLDLGPMREAGVVPSAGLGIGSVVFDPVAADLPTRSQNAFFYGAGIEARPLPRIGVRAEWRRYRVEMENVFEPTDRTGSDRDADRFQASVFWTF